SAVDLATGLDGDFVHRFRFAPELISTQSRNEAIRNLEAEDRANADTELDSAEYDVRRREIQRFDARIRAEENPVPMRINTLFAFGSPSLSRLHDKVRSVHAMFHGSGYRTFSPVGGQAEVWQMMMPGSTRSTIGDDLLCETTADLFGAYAPVRRVGIGDGMGIPIGQSIESRLGDEVYLDLIGATLRGNASIAVTGAQGRGKSHFMKQVVSW